MSDHLSSEIKLNQVLDLYIERLSVGGRGVARYEGAVVFVEKVAPREHIQARVTLLKKNYAEAELVKITTASDARVEPPCRFYSDCGGCSWQHMTYKEQLKQKTQLVHDSLLKMSGFKDFEVLPCLPSPQEFRYRNRVQVHLQDKQLGFYKKNTHKIVPIDDCLITDEKITSQFAGLVQKGVEGRIELKLDLQDLEFSQVNTLQNRILRKKVCELAKSLPPPEHIFDLYSGGGNLTFVLSDTFPKLKVSGVELSAQNITAAQKISGHRNVEFHQAKVEDFLSKTSEDLASSLVVLDPPRTGCDPKVMQILAEQKPSAIIYVSCHPATLARDLKFLSTEYKVRLVQPLDMFPQTDHVECIVGLVRIGISS